MGEEVAEKLGRSSLMQRAVSKEKSWSFACKIGQIRRENDRQCCSVAEASRCGHVRSYWPDPYLPLECARVVIFFIAHRLRRAVERVISSS